MRSLDVTGASRGSYVRSKSHCLSHTKTLRDKGISRADLLIFISQAICSVTPWERELTIAYCSNGLLLVVTVSVEALLDLVTLALAPQGRGIDAEGLCGVFERGRLRQNTHDHLTFHVFKAAG